MNEKLLQYIWQFQYFSRSELTTTAGEELQIISPGRLNTDQGPDFTGARVKLDGMILAGSVEIHLRSSQWHQHGHDGDSNYRNVILHVVLDHDLPGFHLPVLEMKSRIPFLLIERYALLMQSPEFIPCAQSVSEVNALIITAWKERLIAERLVRKSENIFRFLDENKSHWEESFWWLLARNFGTRVNSEAFEAVARSLPLSILARHRNQIQQVEALLFGQAALLRAGFKEDYPRLLQREYQFLKRKYSLRPVFRPIHYLRMRPGNFPCLRLAQLAGLIHQSTHLFSKLLEMEDIRDIKKELSVTANDYWHYHYRLDAPCQYKLKTVGSEMTANIIINTVVPFVFAYGQYHKKETLKGRALRWLEQVPAEMNAITKGFAQLGLHSQTAWDSQAFIELKTQYCDNKYCLKCAVGNALLKTI